MNKIFILTIVLLFFSQVNSRYMQYNNLQPKLNPLQGPALNADPNQRLKETEIYRSNDNNYLPLDEYDNFGGGMGQSQLDYDQNYDLDYGASRVNEEDSRLEDPRYKKGTLENHEPNVDHWYRGPSHDYPAFEDSKSLSKRSPEESSGQEASSASLSGNSKSDNPPQDVAPASSSAVAAEKREDKAPKSKQEQTSSNKKAKNEEVGVAIKEPSGDVERSIRDTEEECEEEAEEPESDADFVWYDEEKNSDLRQDRQTNNNHLFSSGEAKDKSNLISESIDKSSLKTQSKDTALLAPEDQINSESLAPHSSIRKRNIPNVHPLRHIAEELYSYDDMYEGGPNDSDHLSDYDDQGSVQEKNYQPKQ